MSTLARLFSQTEFNLKASLRALIPAFMACALTLFAWYLYGYFYNLSTTLSLHAWGDISYHVQIFYNFVHDRPIQTSLYNIIDQGVLESPFAYASQHAIRVNYLPYLFSPLFQTLGPTVYGLQAFIFAINYLSFPIFGYLILKEHKTPNLKLNTLLFTAMILASSFLYTVQIRGHLILMATPLILSAYYAMLKNSKWGYAISTLLLCLLAEDVALFLVGFSLYALVFEKDRRRLALGSLLFAGIYVLWAVFIVQPSARFDYVMTSGSRMAYAVKTLVLSPSLAIANFKTETIIWRRFLPAFLIPLALYGNFRKVPWFAVIALSVIAPMSQWPIILFNDAGHRIMPLLTFTALGVLMVISYTARAAETHPKIPVRRLALTVLAMAFFAFMNQRIMITNRPIVMGAEQIQTKTSNEDVLQSIREIPHDQTLVYWTNCSIDAFIADRSDIWRFPQYYDLADYLVIQKDAALSWISYGSAPVAASMKDRLTQPTHSLCQAGGKVSELDLSKVTEDLVKKRKLYEVAKSTDHVLVLKRLQKHEFYMPPNSLGLHYFKHMPEVFSRYLKPN